MPASSAPSNAQVGLGGRPMTQNTEPEKKSEKEPNQCENQPPKQFVENSELTEDSIRNNYLPDLSDIMRIALKASCTGKDKEEILDFCQEVSPRGHYENAKREECLLFFNPDFQSLHKAVRSLLYALYDNHGWKGKGVCKPSKKLMEEADQYNPTGTMVSFDESKSKENSCRRKVSTLCAICRNLKTCMAFYGEEISHNKAALPPVAFEIDRNLETCGRLIQSSEFINMEVAFSDIMVSSGGTKEKVDKIYDKLTFFKEKILNGPLEDRRAKMCFLLYRASEYLRHFEEELELKDRDCLISMHHLRTQLSFDLITHSFLLVQNSSPLFDVIVDRFKMLQHTRTQTFFYLEASRTYTFITDLHENIDMKMKVLVDNYSPDMITPEEFVAFANNEGKSMKKSSEKEIEELEGKIEDMKGEAKNCMCQFALGVTKEAVGFLSSVLMPEETKLVESVVFAGVDALKKIKDFVMNNEEEIEQKEMVDVFQHLIKRQELLRKVHYSSMILRKMKGKSDELLTFLHMVRLYNLLTTKKLDTRKNYIGVLIRQRENPLTGFVEYFVRPLDKFAQTPFTPSS